MTEYLIKKGNHYASGLHFGVHFGITEQKYKVKFSKECLYTPDWENDWNKLCGWSYGLHHKNSIRVCWRPSNQEIKGPLTPNSPYDIELCIYVYENETRSTSYSSIYVPVEEVFTLDISYINNYIKAVVNNITPGINIKYSTKPSWGYRLFPYVGGDNVAVQDTRIYLKRL